MTALDTTNLRLTFTAPSNGSVLVRMRCVLFGATTVPQILLGVLDGSTVKARQAPIFASGIQASSATAHYGCTATMVITGLTAGTSYTWDAAYGVEVVVAGTNIKYGGPNDNTTSNAWGAFVYEIWDTPGLLSGIAYDPGTASASVSTNALVAMTVIDTTNLRATFTAPSSGKVAVRLRGVISGTTGQNPAIYLGILDGATVRLRVRPIGGRNMTATTANATDQVSFEANGIVSGLTGGTSYTWDAAYDIETALASGVFKFGGPDNTTTDDAWGQFAYEIWNVDSLPRAVGSVA